VRSRPRAEERQIRNVVNWLKRRAINSAESSFIEETHDLISINHRTRAPLGRWLESFRSLHRLRPFRTTPPFPESCVASSPSITYSSNAMFDRLTNISIVFGGLIMLLAPLWWLEYVSSSVTKLKIVSGFVCGFVGVMMCAVSNRPFEVVASAAAYTAVLMVFMQIDGKGGS
jgi:hypothetical protein